MESILALLQGTGIMHLSWGQAIMLVISLLLLYLAVVKNLNRSYCYRLDLETLIQYS